MSMHRYQTIAATEFGWRIQIESDLETGAQPVFDLGYSHAPHRGLPSLLAFYRLANARVDVTSPVFLGGGSDVRWLAAMIYPDTFARPPLSPHIQILFAGADIATYIATFAAFTPRQEPQPLADAEFGEGTSIYHETIAGAANHIFVAGLRTGNIVDWTSLPIIEMAREPGPVDDAEWMPADSTSEWLAWTVLLFAVALLLLAVIV